MKTKTIWFVIDPSGEVIRQSVNMFSEDDCLHQFIQWWVNQNSSYTIKVEEHQWFDVWDILSDSGFKLEFIKL
jgi:hypothetical protein